MKNPLHVILSRDGDEVFLMGRDTDQISGDAYVEELDPNHYEVTATITMRTVNKGPWRFTVILNEKFQ